MDSIFESKAAPLGEEEEEVSRGQEASCEEPGATPVPYSAHASHTWLQRGKEIESLAGQARSLLNPCCKLERVLLLMDEFWGIINSSGT